MALVFGNSGDLVDHGSAAGLDDLPSSAFSCWAWVYRTADGSNQHIISKDNAFPSGWSLTANAVSGTNGELRFVVFRTDSTGTNWADAISASGLIALNTWTFVAGTYDPATSPQMRLYIGTLSTPVAEVGSYFRQQDGVGSYLSDAAHNLYVGNLQRATTLPFLGRIQRGGLAAQVYTREQLQVAQYGTISQAVALGSPRLAWNYDATGTQRDESGNGNSGTITGATLADGPGLWVAAPALALPFAPPAGAVLAATAAAAATGSATGLTQTQPLAATGAGAATGGATALVQTQPLAASGTAAATGTATRLTQTQPLAATGTASATGAASALAQTQPLVATGAGAATGAAALNGGGGSAALAATGSAAATGTATGLQLVAVLAATGAAQATGSASNLALAHALAASGVAQATGAALALLQTQPLAALAIGIGTGGATALVQMQPLAATGAGAGAGTAALVVLGLVNRGRVTLTDAARYGVALAEALQGGLVLTEG